MDSLKLRAMDDVERIRLELRACERGADDIVRVRCANQEDAKKIDAQLTDEERQRVRFTWLVR